MANRYDYIRFVYITADGLKTPGWGVGAIDDMPGIGDFDISIPNPNLTRPPAPPPSKPGPGGGGGLPKDNEDLFDFCAEFKKRTGLTNEAEQRIYQDLCMPKATVLDPCYFVDKLSDWPLVYDDPGGGKFKTTTFAGFALSNGYNVTMEGIYFEKMLDNGGICAADGLRFKIYDAKGKLIFNSQ